jgi:DNA-binding transcriptional MocR family regulator
MGNMPIAGTEELSEKEASEPGSVESMLAGMGIQRRAGTSLVLQIIHAIVTLIDDGRLRSGMRVPSVRSLARALGISTFTVVEAYERLADDKVLAARPSAGYFVMRSRTPQTGTQPKLLRSSGELGDSWMFLEVFAQNRQVLQAGCGWLPQDWHGDNLVGNAMRQASRVPADRLMSYGHPLGFHRLRHHLSTKLSGQLFPATSEQIVLTHGATHAFDLIIRTLLSPGDTVLVEDPGYHSLFSMLRSYGCRLLPVPRDEEGLHLDVLEAMAREHRPKALFVNTVLQNPLGTTLSQRNAHRILAAAEQHDFWVIEDDIFRDLGTANDPSLAAMDGLNRVLCVGSFSKIIAPSLRVGFVACPQNVVREVLRTKMVTGLTTSELNERAVFEIIADSNHRRHVDRLRTRLTSARDAFLDALPAYGMHPIASSQGGLFVSAGWNIPPSDHIDAKRIADVALQWGITLAPGSYFLNSDASCIWFRFNVGYCADPRLHDFLREAPKRFGMR